MKKFIINNKKTIIACTLMLVLQQTRTLAADPMEKARKFEEAALTIIATIQRLGGIVCICMALFETIKVMIDTGNDVKSAGKVFMKYAIGFLMLYALPWIFEIIKGAFGG